MGEKARTLERRRREDVISALGEHEIGFHSDTHSQHPTVAEYESLLDWSSGVEEFTRRERHGFVKLWFAGNRFSDTLAGEFGALVALLWFAGNRF